MRMDSAVMARTARRLACASGSEDLASFQGAEREKKPSTSVMKEAMEVRMRVGRASAKSEETDWMRVAEEAWSFCAASESGGDAGRRS